MFQFTNRIVIKLCFLIIIIISLIIIYYNGNIKDMQRSQVYYHSLLNYVTGNETLTPVTPVSEYNIWLIYTKVIDKSPLMYNFNRLVNNLMNISSIPLSFNIIVDSNSKSTAEILFHNHHALHVNYYFIEDCVDKIQDIFDVMTTHFSSKPGTYYSDALFYVSLGLDRIAPITQKYAIMLDCDTYLKQDIALLFEEFSKFSDANLFGLAPELSPVYKHILHRYKTNHTTSFGEPITYDAYSGRPLFGFPGYNSGVLLIDLEAMRRSTLLRDIITSESVGNMTAKYQFRGHLGDQDFYTLLGAEHADLVYTLSCAFNRQLCTWWREHGYEKEFERFFYCPASAVVLHGNCNTNILANL